MSRKWLSVLIQAGIVVVTLGAFWLFLEAFKDSVPRWFAEIVGFLTVLVVCLVIWAVRSHFASPAEREKPE
jgi:hypothetical protein